MAGRSGFVPRVNEDEILSKPGVKLVLEEQASMLAGLYREMVPNRSGVLASGIQVGMGYTNYGKRKLAAMLINPVHYAVWNLTGAGPGMHRNSTGREPKYGPFKGAYTFSKIVAAAKAGA